VHLTVPYTNRDNRSQDLNLQLETWGRLLMKCYTCLVNQM